MGGRYSTTVLHTEGNNNGKTGPRTPNGGIDICYLHDTPSLASEIGQGPSIRSLRAEVLRRCTMRDFPRGDIARTSVQRSSIPRGRRTRPYTNGLYCEHLPNKKSLSSNNASSRPRLPSETPSIGTRTTPLPFQFPSPNILTTSISPMTPLQPFHPPAVSKNIHIGKPRPTNTVAEPRVSIPHAIVVIRSRNRTLLTC